MSKDELAVLGDWGKCHRRGAEAEVAEACGGHNYFTGSSAGGSSRALGRSPGPNGGRLQGCFSRTSPLSPGRKNPPSTSTFQLLKRRARKKLSIVIA